MGEPGKYISNAVEELSGVGEMFAPLVGDSRCRPAFKVAAAWSEMDGCLAGEDAGGPSPFKALGSSPSGDMLCGGVVIVLD